MSLDSNDDIIKIIQNTKKILKKIFLKYFDKLFLAEFIRNNNVTIVIDKSDKKGPVIKKNGNNIIR
tara:strand:- start:1182 stop:1379 length:198 start_codon:yes stop_codon:yes gene_type:complete